MARSALNIYRNGRIKSGLSQEKAAEYLHIDTATLRRYETGRVQPDYEMVSSMAALYQSPALIWQHCQTLFPDAIPDIDTEDLRAAAMEMQDAQTAWTELETLANRICKDNAITPDERSDWQQVRGQALRVAAAALALAFCDYE
jgi:transcriptional regulator with XRE-family HTH domain